MGYVETATIILDKDREFQVSFGTIRRFQKKSGKTFQQLANMMRDLQAGDSATADEGEVIELLGTLIWAGCSAYDPELSIDMVFDNLAIDPSEQLAPAFDAMSRAMPGLDEGQAPLANRNGSTLSPGETPVGSKPGLLEE